MLFKVKCVGEVIGEDHDFKIGKIYPVLHVFDNGDLLIPDDNMDLKVTFPSKFIYYDEEVIK